MNTKTLTLISALASLLLLSSCGTSKSTTSGVNEQSSVVMNTTKPLASCNKASNSNMTFGISNIKGNEGQINPQWVKMRFQYLSADMTKNGNYVRFYKWRVISNSTQLDSTPLESYFYSLSNGQQSSSAMSDIPATDIDLQHGLYVNLRDDESNPYQVIKTVVYNSAGTIISQMNVLIPQFLANPEDYKLNADGSNRASLLQQLHPLYGNSNTSSYSASQFEQHFAQFCF